MIPYSKFFYSLFNLSFKLALVFVAYFCLSAVAPLSILNLTDLPLNMPTEAHALWSLQGQVVQVRGFWYALSSKEGILASTSHLKSCCLLSSTQMHSQLLVKTGFPSLSTQKAVTLKGIFKIAPLYNDEGRQIQLYVLEDAQEVHSTTSYFLWGSIGCLLLIFLKTHLTHKKRYVE